MPDLPVAAPDHAETIRRAIPQLDTETWYTDAQIRDALAALLAERRQDKERIERLEAALELIVAAGSERASLSDAATSSDNPAVRREATRIRSAFVDAVDAARAALAVEEDADG